MSKNTILTNDIYLMRIIHNFTWMNNSYGLTPVGYSEFQSVKHHIHCHLPRHYLNGCRIFSIAGPIGELQKTFDESDNLRYMYFQYYDPIQKTVSKNNLLSWREFLYTFFIEIDELVEKLKLTVTWT